MVVYNEGNKKIFITVEYVPNPNGLQACPINQIYVGPGQGIDLDILDLRERPHLHCRHSFDYLGVCELCGSGAFNHEEN